MWPGYFKPCYMYFKLFFFFGKSTLMTGFLKKRNSLFVFTCLGKLQDFFQAIPSLPNMKQRETSWLNLTLTHLLNQERTFFCCPVVEPWHNNCLSWLFFLSFTSLYFICFWLAGLIEADMARRLLNNYNLVNQLDFSAELIENTIRSCSTIDDKVSVDDVIDELKGHL